MKFNFALFDAYCHAKWKYISILRPLILALTLLNQSYTFLSLQMMELSKHIRDLKSILYGDSESEPVSEACTQLTQEFFRENTLRLLITCLPKLNLEVTFYDF